MCTASFMGKLGKLDVAGRMREKISAGDPLMKQMGYAGVDDPASGLHARVEGRKTEVSKKASRIGLERATKAHQASGISGPPAHALNIAARKARGG